MFIYVAVAIALFFAMNIGASGAAAAMGVAYGSGAVKSKSIALLIVAVGVLLGSILGGGEVVKTIGSGIIPTDILTVQIVIVILFSATMTLFTANLLGIPLSTSEVTVGSIVGVGVAFQALYVKSLLIIVSFWVIVPVVAFFIALIAGKIIQRIERRFPQSKGLGKWRQVLILLVVLTGFFEAFSAGMNNVSNAVGPLVGAGLMSVQSGVLWGGLFVALGAFALGRRALETNGKKITSLSLLQGSTISGTGGLLVFLASIFGLPVPLTQVTTCAILGIGTADNGFGLWKKEIIMRIMKVWIVSPVIALVVSYSLVHAILEPNPYALVIIFSVLIATIGTISLYRNVRSVQKEATLRKMDGNCDDNLAPR